MTKTNNKRKKKIRIFTTQRLTEFETWADRDHGNNFWRLRNDRFTLLNSV